MYNDYGTYSSYSSSSTSTMDPAAAAVLLIVMLLIWLPVMVLMIISMWKMFTKAGKPGWASIVPVYNYIVMLEIVGRPMWWVAMFFLPFVNFVFLIMLYIDLAKAFGKDGGFAALLILLPIIGFPILAFSKSAGYVGPVAANGAGYGYGPQPGYPGQQYQQQPQYPQQPVQYPQQPVQPQGPQQPGQPQPPVQQ